MVGIIEGKAVLENNGYSEFVVAISPDVPQDDKIIPEIEVLCSNNQYKTFLKIINK